MALDSENHPVDYISVREIAKNADIATGREINNLIVLANRNLVLLMDRHRSPVLVLYDPVARIPPELLAHFLVSTYVSVMTWWLNSKSSVSTKDIDIAYRHLVLPCLAYIFG